MEYQTHQVHWTDSQGRFGADVTCHNCGYNLRGIRAVGTCPECGMPIAQSTQGNGLYYADPVWLSKLAQRARDARFGQTNETSRVEHRFCRACAQRA